MTGYVCTKRMLHHRAMPFRIKSRIIGKRRQEHEVTTFSGVCSSNDLRVVMSNKENRHEPRAKAEIGKQGRSRGNQVAIQTT